MPGFDIFDTIDTLRQRGESFCVATVLRTADATSAKAGAKAAITGNGEILGHLGGACVQRAVRNSAEQALIKGHPQLISIKPSDKVVAMSDTEGVQMFKSGCPSGGTVDLLVEPYQHAPRLVIFGDTPIARALAAHGALAGFRICLPEGSDQSDCIPFDPADLSPLGIEPRDFVIVASQGNSDSAALGEALASPARRVSMVASQKKAQVLCDKLIEQGADADRVRRLKAPAGLHIHAVDPHEIALSILAEIIKWRNTEKATETFHDEKMA